MSPLTANNKSIRRRLLRQRRFRQLLIGLGFLSIIIGIAVYFIEKNQPDTSITTPFEGIYWATTTLTTVGYGDLTPVTTLGRTLSICLQLLGAMMFGIIVAVIGNFMNRTQEEFYWNRIFERINILEEKIDSLQKRSDYLVKSDAHHEKEDDRKPQD